jgi:predicted dehydrogenase
LSRLEIDVEDTADILMEYLYQGQALPISVHMDYLQQPPTRVCEVIGDAGKAIVDFRVPGIQVFDGTGNPVEDRRFTDFDRNQLFLDELRHFLACLKREVFPLIPVSEGAKSLKMALAAKESMATGQVIETRS